MMNEGAISESVSLAADNRIVGICVSRYVSIHVWNVDLDICVYRCVCISFLCVSVHRWVCVWVSEWKRENKNDIPSQTGSTGLLDLTDAVKQSWPNQAKAYFICLIFWLDKLLHWNSRTASWNVAVDSSVWLGIGSSCLLKIHHREKSFGLTSAQAAWLGCLSGIRKVLAHCHLPFSYIMQQLTHLLPVRYHFRFPWWLLYFKILYHNFR